MASPNKAVVVASAAIPDTLAAYTTTGPELARAECRGRCRWHSASPGLLVVDEVWQPFHVRGMPGLTRSGLRCASFRPFYLWIDQSSWPDRPLGARRGGVEGVRNGILPRARKKGHEKNEGRERQDQDIGDDKRPVVSKDPVGQPHGKPQYVDAVHQCRNAARVPGFDDFPGLRSKSGHRAQSCEVTSNRDPIHGSGSQLAISFESGSYCGNSYADQSAAST